MRVQTILHPTDHSASSEAALRYAAALAHDYAARLLILAVTPTPGPEDPTPPRAGAAEASPARPPARVALEYLVAHGDPVAVILRTAAEHRCDLIILGSGGDPGWKRWLRRSRAEQVIRHAPCPVLVVRAAMCPKPGTQGWEPDPATTRRPELPVAG
jgi:nucleotide-binding universal stress UspA family protein